MSVGSALPPLFRWIGGLERHHTWSRAFLQTLMARPLYPLLSKLR